ncbi:uncharacterized protein LOC143198082 [Rhynchophorus ferrugineus]|uniref:uncharacterized protein LOC143198082 n=1 Tax=Rhynchophorus ferrugineus TaxID=354439 RepID=UPI003FCC3B47
MPQQDSNPRLSQLLEDCPVAFTTAPIKLAFVIIWNQLNQLLEKQNKVLRGIVAHPNTIGLITYIETFKYPQSVKKSRELQVDMRKDSILMRILKYCSFWISPEQDTDSKESNHLILCTVV